MEKNEENYPNAWQSIGIFGLLILSNFIFIAIGFSSVLSKVIGKEEANLIVYILAFGLPLTYLLLTKQKIIQLKIKYQSDIFRLLPTILIFIISIQVGVLQPIVGLIPLPEFVKNLLDNMFIEPDLALFLGVVIIGPIIEELIFRGIILNGLLKNYSFKKSLILSSFLFAVFHLNPWQFFPAFALGLLFGWLFFKTRSIVLTIIAHMLNNLIGFLGILFLNNEQAMKGNLFGEVLKLDFGIIILIGMILSF